MRKERLEEFAKLTKEEKHALTYKDFTISEIQELIDETPLKELERHIAILRYTKGYTFEKIAFKLNKDVTTIKKHLPLVSEQLKTTCTRLL